MSLFATVQNSKPVSDHWGGYDFAANLYEWAIGAVWGRIENFDVGSKFAGNRFKTSDILPRYSRGEITKLITAMWHRKGWSEAPR